MNNNSINSSLRSKTSRNSSSGIESRSVDSSSSSQLLSEKQEKHLKFENHLHQQGMGRGKKRSNTASTTNTTTTTTEINVPMHVVWETLSDLERWNDWNPCVRFNLNDGRHHNNHIDVDAFYDITSVASTGEKKDRSKAKRKGIAGKAKLARWSDTNTQNSKSSRRDKKKSWLLVDCTIDTVSRQDFVVSWTTYGRFHKNTSVMQLSPAPTGTNNGSSSSCSSKRTLLKHTQTLRGGPLSPLSKLLGLDKHAKSLLTQSVFVDQSLKNHVECQYFQALVTDMSTSMNHSPFSSPVRTTGSGKTTMKMRISNDLSSTATMKTEQSCSLSSSSDYFWHSPEPLRKAIISRFVEDDVDDN